MPFSEALKTDLRKRADMRCCVCHAIGVEIHHIIPEAKGGPDTEDNAAPLCPGCHETYGANSQKRKFIREARDNWLDSVHRRLYDTAAGVAGLLDVLRQNATKADVAALRADLARVPGSPLLPETRLPAPVALPLGTILAHIYSFSRPGVVVTTKDVDFLYLFVFGGSLHNQEWDALKETFVDLFGKEGARRLCHFQLQFHKFSLSVDGFTKGEMQGLVTDLIIHIVMLISHPDVTDNPSMALALGIDPDGRIRAWALEHAPVQAAATAPGRTT